MKFSHKDLNLSHQVVNLPLCDFRVGMHALPPEKVAELRAKIEAEREELKQKTDMAEEERNKAADELEKREKDIQESEYGVRSKSSLANEKKLIKNLFK